VLEFEQLLKVFFAENGTKADLLATLAAAQAWARARSQESLAIGAQYGSGGGPFPERLPRASAHQPVPDRLLPAGRRVGPLGQHHRGGLARRPAPRRTRPKAIAETIRRSTDGARPAGG
jgi:hypothetical protein